MSILKKKKKETNHKTSCPERNKSLSIKFQKAMEQDVFQRTKVVVHIPHLAKLPFPLSRMLRKGPAQVCEPATSFMKLLERTGWVGPCHQGGARPHEVKL